MSKKSEKKRETKAKPDHEVLETTEIPIAGDETASDGDGMTLTAEQLDELKQSIAKVQQERDEYLERLQRSQAEFENYRKRNATLRADSIKEGMRDTVEELLPVLDNLERALESSKKEGDGEGLAEGVALICRQFADILGRLGVEEIEAQGCSFDPNLHNAVAQSPCADGEKENVVQEVFQKGYRQGDRVIRHSMVKVSQ